MMKLKLSFSKISFRRGERDAKTILRFTKSYSQINLSAATHVRQSCVVWRDKII